MAALALAALTASQAPGAELAHRVGDEGDRADAPVSGGSPGDDSYHTELPPLESPAPPSASPGGSPGASGLGTAGSESGIPATVLAAYKRAAGSLSDSAPGCGLRWELLAAIGKVESGQARGGAVDKEGNTLKPILGPVLNGSGFARITDSDGGVWDGDARYDRAVGPMQFIPSTWSRWGADGNGDGQRDPGNVYDAALAAGQYLCAGERELAVKADLDRAVLGYNDSSAYLRTVLAWYDFYRKGTHRVPDGSGALPTSSGAGGPGAGTAAGGGGGHAHGHGKGKDHQPDKGGKGKGKGGGKGSGGSSSSRPPSGGSGGHKPGGSSSPTPSPSPTPTQDVPRKIESVGDSRLTATAGGSFPGVKVRVEDGDGKPVKGVRVRFGIVGITGARFTKDVREAGATTGSDGVATAPAVSAGDLPGAFAIEAHVDGHILTATRFDAVVKPKPLPLADTLTRTTTGLLSARPEASFTSTPKIKASYHGAAAKGVPLTATLLTSGALPLPSAEGPHFRDGSGNPVRVLRGLKTGENGQLTLPRLFTDGAKGTFILRLTSPTGTKLDLPLKVTSKR